MAWRRLLGFCVGVFFAAVFAACGGNGQEREVFAPGSHGCLAVGHIRFMNDNLYGRAPFTYRELEAANWIVEQLLAMGYEWGDIEVQEFYWHDPDVARRMEVWADFIDDSSKLIWGEWERRDFSQNVILTVAGQSERKIVVGAHYDTWDLPGASDNASGVALLLESARRLMDLENYYTIVYVFFGAEEIGLVGAYVFLDSLSQEQRDNIVLMINADVLLEGPDLAYGAGYRRGADMAARQNDLTRQVDEIAREIYRDFGALFHSRPNMINSGSDHLPFLEAGFTVMFMASLGTTRIHHTERDCLNYLNENWSGMVEENMRNASIFLERMILEIK